MKHHIIGITGPAGSGKDTAGEILLSELTHYQRRAFGDPIKHMLKTGLWLTDEDMNTCEGKARVNDYGVTNRHMLQTLGTEWGRNIIHPDIWLTATSIRIKAPTVVTDVRFENEADWVREHGTLIHLSGRGGLTGEEATHASERGLSLRYGDIAIDNSRSVYELHCRLKRAIKLMGWE
jgi:dephospho-CoA kinase